MNQPADFVKQIGDRLYDGADSCREQWHSPQGTTTRHFVLDDLLPDATAMDIYRAFPFDAQGFYKRKSFRERKKTSANLTAYHPILTDLTYAFQRPDIIEFIGQMVGFRQLEADPLLYAGGLSIMSQGDFLNPHLDNSHDGERRRYRRLNLLYYVTPDWSLENGGNLELWDDTLCRPKTIVSRFNRLVVMETNRSSWHSVSPVVVPRQRCCVSNYFFSELSPENSDYFHVTSFSGRPGETTKRAVGMIDNSLRSLVSRILKVGRGREQINKQWQ